MTQELLKELYDVISKYEKQKWTIKRPEVVLGKKITFVYSIVNFLKYGTVDIYADIILPKDKASKQFFDELYDVFGKNIEDSDLGDQIYDEVYDAVEEDFKTMKGLSYSDDREYVAKLFYTKDKLNPWKTVLKNFDYNRKPTTAKIVLNSSYEAIIKKDRPVEVGCQRISINKIREIVAAYDSL